VFTEITSLPFSFALLFISVKSELIMCHHVGKGTHVAEDVFECEDLLYTVLELLDSEHLYLLRFVNKYFLQTIRQHYCQSTSSLKYYCSSLNYLTWAIEEGGCPPDMWRSKCALYAAQLGAMDVLEWNKIKQPCFIWDSVTCDAAARGGHLQVLQWLRNQDPPCPWYIRTCSAAAGGGHLGVLQWMRDQHPPCEWDDHTCTTAAAEGHLAILQWLRAQVPPCSWDEWTSVAAARGGH
jgi:hypothetical protein